MILGFIQREFTYQDLNQQLLKNAPSYSTSNLFSKVVG